MHGFAMRKNYLKICVAVCVACLATPTFSQTRSTAMLDALDRIPIAAISGDGSNSLQIEFGDVRPVLPRAMMQAFSADLVLPPHVMALSRILPGDMRQAITGGGPGGFAAVIGIDESDIQTVLSVTARQDRASVFSLSAGAGDLMAQGLLANGYAEETRDNTQVLWRGEHDNGFNLEFRNRSDMFGGNIGRSARIAIGNDIVLHSSAWSQLDGMIAPPTGPSFADDADLRSLVLALDHDGAGQGGLAYAFVYHDASGAIVMVADIVDGVNLSGLLAITTANTVVAEGLAATMAINWATANSMTFRETYAVITGATPVITVVPGEPAVVLLRIDAPSDPTDATFRNHMSQRFMTMIMADDLGTLITP